MLKELDAAKEEAGYWSIFNIAAAQGAGARGEEALAQLERRLLQRIDQLEDRLIAVVEKLLQVKT